MTTDVVSKYITFRGPFADGTWIVLNNRSNMRMAGIYWYPGWRQYVFTTSAEFDWNHECLTEVSAFLRKLLAEGSKSNARRQPDSRAD